MVLELNNSIPHTTMMTALSKSIRATFGGLLLFLACSAQLGAQVPSEPSVHTSRLSPSSMEIPVRISLDPLSEAVEKSVPYQTGYWRGWHRWHGIDTQYRAWRGPLRVSMRGDVLRLEAHVRYWIKARKKVLNTFDLQGSCGVDEPPRQAVVGVLARLNWGPDWSLHPQFKILPTRFLDPCEMTAADIDVTPVVEEVFKQQMKESLATTLTTLLPELNAVRQQAEKIWSLLQEPVHLAEDNWLALRPTAVALAPLHGQNRTLDTHLAVIFYPTLGKGSASSSRPSPLPPLGLFYPRSSGLNMRLAVDLSFADLSRKVSTALASQPFEFEKRKLSIAEVLLSGKAQELSVKARLTGDAAGMLEAWADLVFAPDKQRLELQNLEYVFEPEDPADAMLADLFYLKIRQTLETTANQLLENQLGDWKQHLGSVLTRVAPADLNLDLSSLNLGSAKIDMSERGVNLEGVATGRIRISFR